MAQDRETFSARWLSSRLGEARLLFAMANCQGLIISRLCDRMRLESKNFQSIRANEIPDKHWSMVYMSMISAIAEFGESERGHANA